MLEAAGGVVPDRRQAVGGRSAVTTSSTVSPAASRRPGSATTSISRVSVAETSTRPTPGTRASAGRTT